MGSEWEGVVRKEVGGDMRRVFERGEGGVREGEEGWGEPESTSFFDGERSGSEVGVEPKGKWSERSPPSTRPSRHVPCHDRPLQQYYIQKNSWHRLKIILKDYFFFLVTRFSSGSFCSPHGLTTDHGSDAARLAFV